MDSKLIYTKAGHLLSKMSFNRLPDGGWQYCGRSEDLDVHLLRQTIEHFFPEETIYFASTRHDSRQVNKQTILNVIASNIDDHDFSLWNEDFSRALEFNHIGVFRFGTVDIF